MKYLTLPGIKFWPTYPRHENVRWLNWLNPTRTALAGIAVFTFELRQEWLIPTAYSKLPTFCSPPFWEIQQPRKPEVNFPKHIHEKYYSSRLMKKLSLTCVHKTVDDSSADIDSPAVFSSSKNNICWNGWLRHPTHLSLSYAEQTWNIHKIIYRNNDKENILITYRMQARETISFSVVIKTVRNQMKSDEENSTSTTFIFFYSLSKTLTPTNTFMSKNDNILLYLNTF